MDWWITWAGDGMNAAFADKNDTTTTSRDPRFAESFFKGYTPGGLAAIERLNQLQQLHAQVNCYSLFYRACITHLPPPPRPWTAQTPC